MSEHSNKKRNVLTRRLFLVEGSVSAGTLLLNGFVTATSSTTAIIGNEKFNAGDFTRLDVHFTSMGAELSGWLYQPKGQHFRPLVIMAHGYSATRHMTTDKYAEVFCSQGLAVLLYDHRGFGDSGGQPRHQVNTWTQTQGYLDAAAFARKLPGIDPARIALWGDSLSGGEALVAASIDNQLAALVIQAPALGSMLLPADVDGSAFQKMRDIIVSGKADPDSKEDIEGPMPVVSDDPVRRPCALHPLTAYRWFIEYGGRFGSGWVNDVSRARPKTSVPWYPGHCAPHVTCPSLFMVSPQDEMPGAVPAVSRDAFEKIPSAKEWVDIEGGHFGLLYFPSAEFNHASSVQARFLSKHLL